MPARKFMSKRLWEKGKDIDEQVHAFTVGNDPELDKNLLPFDCLASAAHAKMLAKVGILTAKEAKELCGTLAEIYKKSVKGEFEIPVELEDCHTAIEACLTEKLGDAGKKIHTGRSRNDQVITAVRLYMRSEVLELCKKLTSVLAVVSKRYKELKDIPLPGYTHMQRAMPSSLGMWLHAYYESFLSLLNDGLSVLEALDKNPLGAASGFSVPLELDRKMTAELLGFSQVQRSPVEVQSSRGMYELKALRFSEDIAQVIEKLSWDMILYSMQEFGFFKIPDALTTGSSIMPQKKNPDVLELLRGSAAKVRGASSELTAVIAKLPSHYHRDFQYTKEPLMRGLAQTQINLTIVAEVISSFSVDSKECKKASHSLDLYATYDVYKQVREGKSFRDAYRESAKKIESGKIDIDALVSDYDLIAAQIDRSMKEAEGEVKNLVKDLDGLLEREEKIVKGVLA